MFADDTQLYFIINNVEDTISALNSLVCDLKQWTTKKKLKLNEKKTESLIIGTKHDITKYDGLKEVSVDNFFPNIFSPREKKLILYYSCIYAHFS